jgi:hypothetical protein
MKSSKLPKQAAPVLRPSTSSAPIGDGSGVEASGWWDALLGAIKGGVAAY